MILLLIITYNSYNFYMIILHYMCSYNHFSQCVYLNLLEVYTMNLYDYSKIH